MAEALEEHASQKVINRDIAIEELQKEMDTFEGRNLELAKEVEDLRVGRKVIENLDAKVKSLDGEVASAKASEKQVVAQLEKANSVADNVRKEVEAEKSSNTALLAQVELLNK